GVVVLHHEIFRRRFRLDRREEVFPRHSAVAQIGPAVLVSRLALGCDILEMDGDDAVTMIVYPALGVVIAPDYPGNVHLPFDFRRFGEDDFHGPAAAVERPEFEMMVVPGEPETLVAIGFCQIAEFAGEVYPFSIGLFPA